MNKTKTPEEKMLDIVEKALFTHEPLTKEEVRFFNEYDIKSRGEKHEDDSYEFRKKDERKNEKRRG